MTIKCILFDADGVVINSEMFSVEYCEKYNISSEKMLPFFQKDFQSCLVGKSDLKEIVKPWLSEWKWDDSVEKFLEFWFKAEHKVDQKMVNFIKYLRKKGIKCYLATNQEKYRTNYIKENMGFNELFDYIFSSADIGYKKPQNEFYSFILDYLKNENNVLADEILFFDDTQENIIEAKKLKINAHFYKNFEEFEMLVKQILYNNN